MALLLTATPLSSDGVSYRLVVSPKNPVKSLKRAEVARIFLKKIARFKGGLPAQPVDQSIRSLVRAEFCKDVLAAEGLDKLSAVENYWRTRLFSGQEVPPPVKANDAEVLAYLVEHEGGIGYVTAGARVDDVKVVAIED
jgi:ABC-type phosphate transport system substrate-binding protein